MSMKIVAGLGSVDEYIRYCEAGADEFFCGYVPYKWTKKYGTMMALNRREVLCCNVQIGGEEELEILASMIHVYQKPVHLTFNSLYYLPEQYPLIGQMISNCLEMGFRSYIIADPALILYLHEQGINCEIHLSGELGEMNSGVAETFAEMKLKRIIFHRKNSTADMQAVIEAVERNQCSKAGQMEYEAFVLNELCQFSGSFCNSLHCDELGHLCRVPYWMGEVSDKQHERCTGAYGESGQQSPESEGCSESGESDSIDEDAEADYICGQSGCGLCELYALQKAGITHVKLVGRGNYVDSMEQDIRKLRKALEILGQAESEELFKKKMKQELFSGGCSGNCYYLQE